MGSVSAEEGPQEGRSSPDDNFSVLQFNMWGWVGYRGRQDIGHATARCILGRRPEVVTLNEACLSQVETIQEDLDRWGLHYRFHHDLILHRKDKSRSCEFGNAIMWNAGRPGDREAEKFLSVPAGEQPRKIMAVRMGFLRLPTVACVTHLTSGRRMRATREQQVAEVADFVTDWKDRGYEVLVGGDFNEQPGSSVLDPMYLPIYGGRSRGLCHEAGSSERPAHRVRKKPFTPTHRMGFKYDYIFMTAGYEPRGVSVPEPISDHHPYFATIL